jgi:uncharacterized protein YraI
MRKLLLATLAIGLALSSQAMAQPRCRVTDPTGTPLNLRSGPNGKIVGTLPNGVLVSTGEDSVDARGNDWVSIARYDNRQPLGWVFREFVSCF